MPFRVQNTKTKHVYTVGVVGDDETDITSDATPAMGSGGSSYLPPVYGDEAASEVSASKKSNNSTKGS
jgi:hypothetical protein